MVGKMTSMLVHTMLVRIATQKEIEKIMISYLR